MKNTKKRNSAQDAETPWNLGYRCRIAHLVSSFFAITGSSSMPTSRNVMA
jgi:hypothetical protein